jgi:hypothetical protein
LHGHHKQIGDTNGSLYNEETAEKIIIKNSVSVIYAIIPKKIAAKMKADRPQQRVTIPQTTLLNTH